jgi:hypothetical protein
MEYKDKDKEKLKEQNSNLYTSLNCSEDTKEIIMKLSQELKENENALEKLQLKYEKKKINKKQSINDLENKNKNNKKIISSLKQIIINIIENKGIEIMVSQ